MTSQEILERTIAMMEIKSAKERTEKMAQKPSLMQTAGLRKLDGNGLCVVEGLRKVLEEIKKDEVLPPPATAAKKKAPKKD